MVEINIGLKTVFSLSKLRLHSSVSCSLGYVRLILL